MSAFFNSTSLFTVLLLSVCTCTYIKLAAPALLKQGPGLLGLCWKFARIGERLSPAVSLACVALGLSKLAS